jgi:hypothetical protein
MGFVANIPGTPSGLFVSMALSNPTWSPAFRPTNGLYLVLVHLIYF